MTDKKSYIINFCSFFCVLLIDQFSKIYALSNYNINYNDSFVFGVFSNLPLMIRVSFLVSFFGIVLLTYFVLVYLLNEKLFYFKISLSILVGGISGNVLDKLVHNKAIDFINFNLGEIHIVYNIADVAQICSIIYILFVVFRRDHLIWFPEDKRSRIFLYPKSQLIFSAQVCGAAMSGYLIIFIFAYSVISTSFNSYVRAVPDFWSQFTLSALILGLLLFLVIFLFSIKISNQYFGPIYKLEQYVLKKDFTKDFKLRENDRFKNLEDIISSIRLDK